VWGVMEISPAGIIKKKAFPLFNRHCDQR